MSNSPTFKEIEKLAEEFFDFPTEQRLYVTHVSAILFAQYVVQATANNQGIWVFDKKANAQ